MLEVFKEKRNKGVLTVETALLMPIIIYIIFLMIFMFILIYSKIYVSLSVNHVVSEVTAKWYSRDDEFDTTNHKNKSIIADAFATSLSTDDKIKVVKSMLEERVKTGMPMKYDFSSDIKCNNYLIGESLTIKTKCTYTMPIKGILKFFNISNDGKITDESVKVVNLTNNEANMRSIDYCAKKVSKGIEKLKETLDDIKEKFIFKK